MDEIEATENKVFTQEDIDRDYVKKNDYEALLTQYKELVAGFNKLAAEYNELHIKALLPSLATEPKKA